MLQLKTQFLLVEQYWFKGKEMSALNIKQGTSSQSAYDLRSSHSDNIETHTLAVVVDNEAGVLARVIGLFSGRGYNIESLTVAEFDHEGHRSRITIVTTGTPRVIEQIKAELGRMVPVYQVNDLTVEGPSVCLLYTSPSPRDLRKSRMPSSA